MKTEPSIFSEKATSCQQNFLGPEILIKKTRDSIISDITRDISLRTDPCETSSCIGGGYTGHRVLPNVSDDIIWNRAVFVRSNRR